MAFVVTLQGCKLILADMPLSLSSPELHVDLIGIVLGALLFGIPAKILIAKERAIRLDSEEVSPAAQASPSGKLTENVGASPAASKRLST
jgi:hypothetical protein